MLLRTRMLLLMMLLLRWRRLTLPELLGRQDLKLVRIYFAPLLLLLQRVCEQH
jgi:hypothetical protein